MGHIILHDILCCLKLLITGNVGAKIRYYETTRRVESLVLNALADVDTVEAEVALDNLVVGLDSSNDELSYGDLSDVLCLLFPYLFTNGRD